MLVYAPDYFYIAHSDGSASMGTDPKPGRKYDALLENDFFTAGMTLDLPGIVENQSVLAGNIVPGETARNLICLYPYWSKKKQRHSRQIRRLLSGNRKTFQSQLLCWQVRARCF